MTRAAAFTFTASVTWLTRTVHVHATGIQCGRYEVTRGRKIVGRYRQRARTLETIVGCSVDGIAVKTGGTLVAMVADRVVLAVETFARHAVTLVRVPIALARYAVAEVRTAVGTVMAGRTLLARQSHVLASTAALFHG